MKATTILKLIAAVTALQASPSAYTAEEQDHGHEHEESGARGPNGGRVITSKAGFAFEITVDKERKARIVFLDKDNKTIPLAGQAISGIAGARSAPTKLAFAKGAGADANALISDKPLPAGAHVPVILMIQTAPDAKAVAERFELHLH